MSIDPMFQTLSPSRIVVFTRPNPVNHRCHLRTPRIRVAVLDSPVAVVDGVPKVAAMMVPENRETDWNFCTDSGHLQLLFDYPSVSRLILIGNDLPPNPLPRTYIRPPETDTEDIKKLEDELQPLVMSLHPKVCFQNGLPETGRFLTYEDDLLYRKTIARFVGPVVGEFVVEDVLIESNDDSVDEKLRRILKFKRTPTLIQSQVLLYPKIDGEIVTAVLNLVNLKKMIKNAKFYIDTTVLVHPYLIPMVSGLFLIASHLSQRIQLGFTPRALCLGVGGGALLTFLNTELGFEVVGVEADEVVLSAAKQYFGLNNGKSELIVGDAIDLILNFVKNGDVDDSDSEVKNAGLDAKFDVVMVDLYSSEARYGITAPPPEFVKKPVFEGLRLLLDDHGVLIINVVLLDNVFYMKLIQELKDVFDMVYETEVEDEDNRVVMATVSPPTSINDHDYPAFLKKLRSVIPADYDNCIESIDEL